MDIKIKFFLLICALTYTSTNLYAWSLVSDPPSFYKSDKIKINFASTSCAGAGLDQTSLQNHTKEAIENYWNSVSEANLELVIGDQTSIDIDGETSAGTMAQNLSSENSILIGCNDDVPSFAGTTQGQGSIQCTTTGLCFGALIISSHVNSQVPNFSAEEIQALIAHEIGHTLGLGHSSNEASLMYYSLSSKYQEKLHQDDINGLTYLYPNEKELGGILGSCGTIDLDSSGGGPGRFAFTFLFGFFLIVLGKRIVRLSGDSR